MTCTTRDVCLNSRFYIAAHDIQPAFCMQFVFEGNGILDLEHWVMAVKVASAANPSSRMVLRRYVHFSRLIDSEVTPPVRVIDAKLWDKYEYEKSHLLNNFHPRTGPMTEVFLIKGGENPRVAMRAHHTVMDGRGLMTWAEDIFRALRGEEVRKSDDTIITPHLLNPSYKPAGRVTGRCLAPTGLPRGCERGVTYVRRNITGSFSKIPAKVALVSAREAWRHRNGNVRFGIPLDLRSRRPGLKTTGNLTSAIFMPITPDMNLEDITAEINRKLSAQEDGYANIEDKLMRYLPIKVLGHLLRIDGDYSHKLGLYRYSGFISNVGLYKPEMFKGGGFSTHAIHSRPVCLEGIPFMVVMVGVEKRLELVAAAPRVLANNGRLEALLDRIIEGLA